MKTSRRLPFVLLIAAMLLPLAGCIFQAGRIARVQSAMEAHYPDAHFERELVLDLGPSLLTMGAWLAGGFLPSKKRVYGRYLLDMDHATIGIYKVQDLPDAFGTEPIIEILPRGWHTVVKVREEGEFVWIGRQRGNHTLRGLYVVTLSEDELVLLRLEGEIGEVLTKVLTRHDVLDMVGDEM